MTVNDGLVEFHEKTIRLALVHHCHRGHRTGQQQDNSARTARAGWEARSSPEILLAGSQAFTLPLFLPGVL
mgnify:CR=1 FL=1